jgi:hypothetical protein
MPLVANELLQLTIRNERENYESLGIELNFSGFSDQWFARF